ncbi:MAG: ROK family protein [Bacteroidales bacterium]|nr:ROK family protein [Bacteroidales bacterium]
MSNETKPYAIGIDMGGTNTDIGLVDRDGHCLARKNLPMCRYTEIGAYVADVAAAIHQLVADRNLTFSEIAGAGIGAPNGNFFTGCIEHASNLVFTGVVPLAKLLGEQLPVPVALTNDANAAALGEKVYGGAREMDDFIVITLGTGVGSGIFADGKLVYGHDGFGGEVGHTILHPGGRLCTCGRRGCLEEYTSARGIVQNYNDLCKEMGVEPHEGADCQWLSEAADRGDETAIRTWVITAEHLGIGIANAATTLAPEAIFLMGGIIQAGHWLFDPLRIAFNEHLLCMQRDKIAILPTQLNANDAAILGAAALVQL